MRNWTGVLDNPLGECISDDPTFVKRCTTAKMSIYFYHYDLKSQQLH